MGTHAAFTCAMCTFIAALVVVGADTADASAHKRVSDSLGEGVWGDNVSGPLCGVYAACTALKMVGVNADPHDFIATRYVGNCGGSTPEEIVRVIGDSRAEACILKQLSAVDLQLLNCPLIANVRSKPAGDRFNHWIVAIPSETGVKVFDGVQQPYEITIAEFLGIWSGIGISVSRSAVAPQASIWLGRLLLFLIVTLIFAGVLQARPRLSKRANRFGFVKQAGVLVAVSIAMAFVGNTIFGDLTNHWRGVATAAAPVHQNYRVGTLDDIRKASDSSKTLLVDARREEDFKLGSVESAVNIPITASTWEIKRYLKNLDRTTPIVIFCQSAYCAYDETVAAELASLGFIDLTVCSEGWVEYKKLAMAAVE